VKRTRDTGRISGARNTEEVTEKEKKRSRERGRAWGDAAVSLHRLFFHRLQLGCLDDDRFRFCLFQLRFDLLWLENKKERIGEIVRLRIATARGLESPASRFGHALGVSGFLGNGRRGEKERVDDVMNEVGPVRAATFEGEQ